MSRNSASRPDWTAEGIFGLSKDAFPEMRRLEKKLAWARGESRVLLQPLTLRLDIQGKMVDVFWVNASDVSGTGRTGDVNLETILQLKG